jgi:DNA gyrase subunit A
VNAIKLADSDEVIGSGSVKDEEEILLVSSDGKGWHLSVEEFPIQGRYGRGVSAGKLNPDTILSGVLIGAKQAVGAARVKSGTVTQIQQDDIPLGKRSHTGKPVMTLKVNDSITQLIPIKAEGLHHRKRKLSSAGKKIKVVKKKKGTGKKKSG